MTIKDIRNGDLSAIQIEITTAAIADNKGNDEEYAVNLAVRFQQVDILNYLIGIGADVNKVSSNGYCAIHWAAHNNNEAMLDILLAAGANASATHIGTGCLGYSALQMAAARGYDAILQKLIDNGAALDAENKIKNTALHLASSNNNLVSAQKLIDAGADKTIVNNAGKTAVTVSTSPEMDAILL